MVEPGTLEWWPLSPGESAEASRRPLRERQQRRTRQDLLRAALEVIADVGLDQATVQRIITRAGTARATLYAHFPEGRDELITEAYRALGGGLLRRAEVLAADEADWVDRVCQYARVMVELASKRQLGAFYNVSGPRLAGIKDGGSGSQRTIDTVTAELAGAQRRGEIRNDLDARSIAVLLVGSIREIGIDTARDPAAGERGLTAFRQLVGGLREGAGGPPPD